MQRQKEMKIKKQEFLKKPELQCFAYPKLEITKIPAVLI
ncbi:Uncharacterized protein dnl_48260 [Desulfonema limicola]|uniref:Uncharacterized protein n=1 Tax=Desulfonema limicola TaxID=45656 RepID=A0A975GIH6_9BACT|nr:Uncharacterized protein dnl_48260 [Desulfonema limicola]